MGLEKEVNVSASALWIVREFASGFKYVVRWRRILGWVINHGGGSVYIGSIGW